MKPVKLQDLIDEMDMQSDEQEEYLNKETGEIIIASDRALSIAEESEDGDDFSKYSDWQRKEIFQALDVIENSKNYIELPSKWEINEYDIMEDFCLSIEDNRLSNKLYSAIKGRGAFRRFKDDIYRYGIEKKWYVFHEEALKEIAIGWCEDNGIDYVK